MVCPSTSQTSNHSLPEKGSTTTKSFAVLDAFAFSLTLPGPRPLIKSDQEGVSQANPLTASHCCFPMATWWVMIGDVSKQGIGFCITKQCKSLEGRFTVFIFAPKMWLPPASFPLTQWATHESHKKTKQLPKGWHSLFLVPVVVRFREKSVVKSILIDTVADDYSVDQQTTFSFSNFTCMWRISIFTVCTDRRNGACSPFGDEPSHPFRLLISRFALFIIRQWYWRWGGFSTLKLPILHAVGL